MSIYNKLFQITSTMDKMKKDSENPFYKSRYFDVNQLIESLRPEFIKHDLLLLQPIENGAVGSRIIDIKTGDSVESFIPLPDQNDPQKVGSAITYYRRYSLQSLLGIEAEDDDANLASKGSKSPKASKDTNDDKEWLNEGMDAWNKAEAWVRQGNNPHGLRKKYKVSKRDMEYFESIAIRP